jgi:hypothetical protein
MHFIENYRSNWKARVFQMSIPSSPLQSIRTFGRAMGRAVSYQPLTAEAWVRARFSPCGLCGGQSGTGTGFSSNSSVSPVNIILPWLSMFIYCVGFNRGPVGLTPSI